MIKTLVDRLKHQTKVEIDRGEKPVLADVGQSELSWANRAAEDNRVTRLLLQAQTRRA